jgi:hypothetical protein
MLKLLRRWIRGGPDAGREALQAWCESTGWALRGIRDEPGFVIETRPGELAGRIEWGPSHRHYLGAHELRLRGELVMPADMHAVVMPKPLMDTVESELFAQAVGKVRTRIDDTLPEEVRWLAVSPRLSGALMGELRADYAAASSHVPWLAHWMQGPLGDALAARAKLAPADAPPFALIAHRGRLTLRVAMPDPDVAGVQAAMHLFDLALAQARLSPPPSDAEDDGG